MLQGSEYSYLNNQQSNHQIIRNQEDVSQRGREKRERERQISKVSFYRDCRSLTRYRITHRRTDVNGGHCLLKLGKFHHSLNFLKNMLDDSAPGDRYREHARCRTTHGSASGDGGIQEEHMFPGALSRL